MKKPYHSERYLTLILNKYRFIIHKCNLMGIRIRANHKPNDMDLYLELATTHSKVGNFTAAIRVYQIAVGRQPSLAEGYRGLGEVYIRQRDWKNAIMAYTKLTEIHPQDAPAWERLGRIYINGISSISPQLETIFEEGNPQVYNENILKAKLI